MDAGEQAAVLNKIIENWQTADDDIFGTQLKELLGHTPLQVFFGALLGIIVGLFFPL
jgi:acid phosphatase family membrane protein YuiD